MTVEEYYQLYGSRITQDSERLFIDDFLYPLLGSKIGHIEPHWRPERLFGRCMGVRKSLIGRNAASWPNCLQTGVFARVHSGCSVLASMDRPNHNA